MRGNSLAWATRKVTSRLNMFEGTAQMKLVVKVEMPTTVVVDEEKRGIIKCATNEIGVQDSRSCHCCTKF